MYNREHVTMYLLSLELVVDFRVVQVSRLRELYKLFPFFPSRYNVILVVRVDEPAGEPETTRARARSKLNTKLKTHVLGVNHAETAGSVRFMTLHVFLSISHSRDAFFSTRVLRFVDRSDKYIYIYIRVLTGNTVRKKIRGRS